MTYRIEEAHLEGDAGTQARNDAARACELLSELVACWRRSVEATHGFLTPHDVDRIAAYVPDAIAGVARLAVCRDADGRLLGFMGVEDAKVEMLFVEPDLRGRGVGKALLGHAVRQLGATEVDVNEQNEQAVGFYLRQGFEVASRSETDGMGDPFPILHLKLKDA